MRHDHVFHNAKWIVICKVAQSLLQLLVGVLCARYLGPSNYGLINYAASVCAFATPIMRLGFNSTLVNEFVDDPQKEGEIMGTALVMNVLSSLVCIAGIFCFVSASNQDDFVTITVCVIYSLSLLFGALEMIQYWFQYKLLSKYASVAMLMAYVVVSAYRILLLITGKSVFWFAATNSLDYGIIGVSLILVFYRLGNRFSFSLERAKKMLSSSRHFIWASMMVVIFQSTDHIMLTAMIGAEENGYYSAAITCTTVMQFVYLAIVDSYRPMILLERKKDYRQYKHEISRLYCVICYMAVTQSVLFTIFAKHLVWLLYGVDYMPVVTVLRILIWYIIFSCIGVVRNVWILAEQRQKYLWKINLCGALANVALNLIMIPPFGAAGAAVASLLTQFFTNFVLGFLLKPIRKNNILLLRGLHPGFALRETKTLLNALRSKAL